MRLAYFRIKNYRSIVDSGRISLSQSDNVTVLAGQNESGKSSVLRALQDFERGEFSEGSAPFSVDDTSQQEVACSYEIEDHSFFVKRLSDHFIDEKKIAIEGKLVLDESKLQKLKSFTVTRKAVGSKVKLDIDDAAFHAFRAAICLRPATDTADGVFVLQPYFEIADNERASVAKGFWRTAPLIVFFDDFCDLLPDKILVSALKADNEDTEGYRAVRNLEQILDTNLQSKDDEKDAVRRTRETSQNKELSINFQHDWGQRIHGENEVSVKYNFEKREGEPGSYINFYVETKEGQPLPPKQRSKGLIWFLSLWLELKAKDSEYDHLILLLDEPDQHLHVKAQKDILRLINSLATSGKQIIYSTHSHYLIETDLLHRVKLVVNDQVLGTSIEDVTTCKIDSENKKDALQPIADAIGMAADEFSRLQERNVFWRECRISTIFERCESY